MEEYCDNCQFREGCQDDDDDDEFELDWWCPHYQEEEE